MESASLCTLCQLRFRGDHCRDHYAQYDLSSPPEETVCWTCLGILQNVSEIWKQVEAKLSEDEHDQQEYCFTIQLPPVLLLRQYYYWLSAHTHPDVTSTYASVVDMKDTLRWVLESRMSSRGSNVTTGETLRIGIQLTLEGSEEECECLRDMDSKSIVFHTGRKSYRNDKKRGNVSVKEVMECILKFPVEMWTKYVSVDVSQTYPWQVGVHVERDPLFIGGQYCKYVRVISQTPFTDEDGNPLGIGSVEEYVNPVIDRYFQCTSAKFSASGREDMDVRMLGEGREFVVELVDAKKGTCPASTFEEMMKEINEKGAGKVSIHSLRMVDRKEVKHMRQMIEKHRKWYKCIVKLDREVTLEDKALLDGMVDVHLAQTTPCRVMHRRAIMVRDKVIHKMEVTLLGGMFFMLALETSSGTYVKEFVHGDLGRTTPSIHDLLSAKAAILQLDVVGVESS